MRALLRSACCLQLAFSQISQARLSKTDKDPEQHRTEYVETAAVAGGGHVWLTCLGNLVDCPVFENWTGQPNTNIYYQLTGPVQVGVQLTSPVPIAVF